MKPNTKESKMIIEENIPMPKARLNVLAAIAGIMTMKVGNSFLCKRGNKAGVNFVSEYTAAQAWRRRQNPKVKFSARAVDEDHFRVWRTE